MKKFLLVIMFLGSVSFALTTTDQFVANEHADTLRNGGGTRISANITGYAGARVKIDYIRYHSDKVNSTGDPIAQIIINTATSNLLNYYPVATMNCGVTTQVQLTPGPFYIAPTGYYVQVLLDRTTTADITVGGTYVR